MRKRKEDAHKPLAIELFQVHFDLAIKRVGSKEHEVHAIDRRVHEDAHAWRNRRNEQNEMKKEKKKKEGVRQRERKRRTDRVPSQKRTAVAG